MVYTLTVHLYAKDDPTAIEKLRLKLIEASRVYRQDTETIDWLVMQDVHDKRAFTIVERFENEAVGFHSFPLHASREEVGTEQFRLIHPPRPPEPKIPPRQP